MNFELLKLSDGTVPEGSPLRDVSINVERTAAYETPEYYPSYVWVDDPEWTATDSRGHEHYREGDEFPTLRPVYQEVYGCGECCGDYDSYEILTHHECLGCGEGIEHAGKKQERYVPQIPAYTEFKLSRVAPYGGPLDLMGIEPVEATGNGDTWELLYAPSWDEWLKLVEENNRIVREVAS